MRRNASPTAGENRAFNSTHYGEAGFSSRSAAGASLSPRLLLLPLPPDQPPRQTAALRFLVREASICLLHAPKEWRLDWQKCAPQGPPDLK